MALPHEQAGVWPVEDRWAAGEADGLEVLYALHGPSCYGLALAILRDAHHAEDAVQEAFVDLWRSRARFAPAARPSGAGC